MKWEWQAEDGRLLISADTGEPVLALGGEEGARERSRLEAVAETPQEAILLGQIVSQRMDRVYSGVESVAEPSEAVEGGS